MSDVRWFYFEIIENINHLVVIKSTFLIELFKTLRIKPVLALFSKFYLLFCDVKFFNSSCILSKVKDVTGFGFRI
jgi:hypothetical protein